MVITLVGSGVTTAIENADIIPLSLPEFAVSALIDGSLPAKEIVATADAADTATAVANIRHVNKSDFQRSFAARNAAERRKTVQVVVIVLIDFDRGYPKMYLINNVRGFEPLNWRPMWRTR